jgi:malate synthase
MSDYVTRGRLQVAPVLAEFLESRALPGTGIAPEVFWSGFSELLHGSAPKNKALLDKRQDLQAKIDAWHIARRGQPHDADAYEGFLREIGYLTSEGEAFSIDTDRIDPEIATVAGPQLVVPITNARFALNAANARWGSLYDAFYGTDAMGSQPKGGGYDRGRGARVVARARVFLDSAFPIEGHSHADARRYHVDKGQLLIDDKPLESPEKFAGYRGHPKAPERVLLVNNGLHVELVFDRTHPIGSRDQAGLADVRMEAAVSAIMDCEDSVACVDAEDKVQAYGNWLGLMQGDLSETFEKGGQMMTRALAPDLDYVAPDGKAMQVKGRALMLVRNVGHLMTNPAILLEDGSEVYEGLMDAMITVLIALHDLKKDAGLRNSHAGSVYVVKPKMHGPEEVAFADETFSKVEEVLGLPRYTVKLGVMDEERRTSVNLKECIRAAKHRGGLHQHRLPRPDGRRDPHLDGGGAVFPQGFHQAQELDRRLREPECRYRAGMRAARARADRQGHVGQARPMAEMLEAKIEHPRAGPIAPGCRRPRPRRCTRCITTRSMSPQVQAGWRRAGGAPM